MRQHEGALSLATRARLVQQAFRRTAAYDAAIFEYLGSNLAWSNRSKEGEGASFIMKEFLKTDATIGPDDVNDSSMFSQAELSLYKKFSLRYGENPHQRAALYDMGEDNGVANAEVLSGKEMSFNNYIDADAAWQLVCDFDETACAIIKHMNPAGVGTGVTVEEAYRRALATDPVSAFGGIVAFNRTIDEAAARALTEIFTEVVIASDYDETALEVLRAKKNLRVLRAGEPQRAEGLEYKTITGGMLVQTRDTHSLSPDDLKVVTKRAPTEEERRALLFAWTVCKHTKSNAIVYARPGQTIGVGAGQMSRIDSVKIGAARAQLPVKGSVLASDAFFPFRDGIDEAARHGITAIIQPGGSVRDQEVIDAANEHNLAMVFTGVRHFKH
jgi:phosphoribosylaminoimidazolecarboxamide formyltransferase/IMP cyclohydrolase